MPDTSRPTLETATSLDPVRKFIEQWQAAIDTGNADLFNQAFARDVLWGSPFGAIAEGYDQIHAIHAKMFASVPPSPGAAIYELERSRQVSEDVIIAFVRRTAVAASGSTSDTSPGSFDELAMIVLVQRDGSWWLAAAQHVPDKRYVYK